MYNTYKYTVNVVKGDRNLIRLAAQAQDHLELSCLVHITDRRFLTQKEVCIRQI